MFFPLTEIKRSHRFVSSKKCVGKEDKAFLYMYTNIFLSFFPLVRVLFFFVCFSFTFFFCWNLSICPDPMYFLLLPFSNLEVNCCFGQHCYSHKRLARLHCPDGLGTSFYCWGHLFLLCRSHASHWSCYKAPESPSDSLWKKPSLGIVHIGARMLSLLTNYSLPVLKLQVFEGMQNHNIWQSLSLMSCHYNHCESDKACQPSKPKCHAGCESWVWDG